MRTSSRPFSALATLLALTASPSSAFNYDEGELGDLAEFQNPTVFAFDAGLNVVLGSTGVVYEPYESDPDVFGFLLPDGMAIASVLFEYELTGVNPGLGFFDVIHQINVFADDGTWTSSESAISAAVATLLSDGIHVVDSSPVVLEFIDIVDSNAVPGAHTLPLSGGPFVFAPGVSFTASAGGAIHWTYRYTFDVVAIPEPGAALSIGLGLAMLGLRRRRAEHARPM